jgi:predicted Rossmann fold nucleotide-binding protein DprA/Smf involved in DNA uptake
MTQPQRVEKALRHGALSAARLVEATGTNADSLRQVLARMAKKGRVAKLPDERWGRSV